ncbi:unnamed protein product [Adineta steineri]|uniref:Uncharacterized protein n=1 Tax=Adineta steineri TaxID=433720 RepID=A0A819AWV9_9BILA|nr:unnamed protein product [Adineta steineri]CAF1292543.1 unnamed protein product [Adineta steineri]CAF3481498.1 unnamed protein product [Adineta steineri]CAF3791815.1 unnamed protein product [Adineta steineri]
MDAYRLDQREVHTDNVNDNTDLTDPDFIQKLQKLIEAAAIVYTGNGNKDSAAEPDHEINTRLAANRRPGLIRLKKSE